MVASVAVSWTRCCQVNFLVDAISDHRIGPQQRQWWLDFSGNGPISWAINPSGCVHALKSLNHVFIPGITGGNKLKERCRGVR